MISRTAIPGLSLISARVLARAARSVWRESVTGRIRAGALRDHGWPTGLRTLVWIGTAAAVVAALLALFSEPIRRSAELVVTAPGESGVPRAWIWLVLVLLVVAAALFQVAATHGPWWLRGLGLVVSIGLMSIWGVPGVGSEELPYTLLTAAAVLVLVVFCLVRGRLGFAWWEFCVLVVVIGAPLVGGLVELGRSSRVLGFEFTPAYLSQALALSGALVLPLFVAAGFAVANLAVGVTAATLRQAKRLPGGHWPFGVLVAVVVFRAGQSTWELLRGRLAGDDLSTFLPALGVAATLALLVVGLRLLGRRPTGAASLTVLTEQASRIALPVGVALAGLLLPVILVTQVQSVLSSLGVAPFRTDQFNAAVISTLGTDFATLVITAVLLGLAVVEVRAGRYAFGLVLGCCAVLVLTQAMRFVTGNRWPIRLDVDALNLVATVLTLLVAGGYAVRRALTPDRALALAGLLILSALFSYRDLLTDPVGAVVGYTGAGLVLVGIGWDFLTGSDWGNGSSRPFPTPTRVLLLVVKLMLPAVLVAFAALVRETVAVGDLDVYARLGNQVLGTALLAAAYIAVLQLVIRNQPLAPDSATRVSPEPGVARRVGLSGVAESGDLAETAVTGDWPLPAEATRHPGRPE